MNPLDLPAPTIYRLLHAYLLGNLVFIDIDFNLQNQINFGSWTFRLEKMLSLFEKDGPLER
jgi:hypothetical protein